jgi:hypothetical protein
MTHGELIEEINSKLIVQELWKNRRLIEIFQKEISSSGYAQRIILDEEISKLTFLNDIIERNMTSEIINNLYKSLEGNAMTKEHKTINIIELEVSDD